MLEINIPPPTGTPVSPIRKIAIPDPPPSLPSSPTTSNQAESLLVSPAAVSESKTPAPIHMVPSESAKPQISCQYRARSTIPRSPHPPPHATQKVQPHPPMSPLDSSSILTSHPTTMLPSRPRSHSKSTPSVIPKSNIPIAVTSRTTASSVAPGTTVQSTGRKTAKTTGQFFPFAFPRGKASAPKDPLIMYSEVSLIRSSLLCFRCPEVHRVAAYPI